MTDGQPRGFMQYQDVRAFLDSVLDSDIHAKRVDSLANATLGVMTGASLGVAIIGQSLAQARGLVTKHAVKQVDRLLSNRRIDAWDVFATWVPETVGSRPDIVVALDWTDYDADGQATLALKLVTRHGRATPLVWLSVFKDELRDARNAYEDAALRRLAAVLPTGTKVTVLADRGFADTKLFGFLAELGFDYVIRLKGNTQVSAADGTTRPAAEWVGQGGRARKLRDATVTAAQCPVGAVVCVHAMDMQEPWCLATSNRDATAPQIIKLYGKRWGVEPAFRDTKDLRFGLGLSSVRIADPQRRDRLLLLNAFALALLTLLGAAGESLGMDRHLKVNTVKTRSHSLFRQGCMLYDLIPTMPEHRLRPLVERFAEMLKQSRVITETFSTL
ncbi:MAG TPA: IS4 family transposase [Hyphomicrobiaceae bacterium]|nr:IS4 family transposase [Hyphomicrobiaceae bacterium]